MHFLMLLISDTSALVFEALSSQFLSLVMNGIPGAAKQ